MRTDPTDGEKAGAGSMKCDRRSALSLQESKTANDESAAPGSQKPNSLIKLLRYNLGSAYKKPKTIDYHAMDEYEYKKLNLDKLSFSLYLIFY
ncbi:MAG: hypothetical protein BHW64_02395 [Candidatus Melainabacteria bacterium LEY3_CP_29_8]|nr:MAG: hypothetical protein BHW64_02395 [Candidatus Melainabacteria bacterium LEY3_CP_29_8]